MGVRLAQDFDLEGDEEDADASEGVGGGKAEISMLGEGEDQGANMSDFF